MDNQLLIVQLHHLPPLPCWRELVARAYYNKSVSPFLKESPRAGASEYVLKGECYLLFRHLPQVLQVPPVLQVPSIQNSEFKIQKDNQSLLFTL